LPHEVWERLVTFYMSYDDVSEDPPDWNRLMPVIEEWANAFDKATRGKKMPRPLTYQRLGSALLIEDRIHGRSHTLRDVSAEVYLYCMQRRGLRQIADRFRHEGLDAAAIEAFLGNLVEKRLVFREGNSYLSLAVAITPRHAAHRIRRTHADDRATGLERLVVVPALPRAPPWLSSFIAYVRPVSTDTSTGTRTVTTSASTTITATRERTPPNLSWASGWSD